MFMLIGSSEDVLAPASQSDDAVDHNTSYHLELSGSTASENQQQSSQLGAVAAAYSPTSSPHADMSSRDKRVLVQLLDSHSGTEERECTIRIPST